MGRSTSCREPGCQGTEYRISSSRCRVLDLPARLRPREELERVGLDRASDAVLLAVVLRSGVAGTNVVDLARELIAKYGSLTGLARSSVDELASERGMGKVKAQVLKAALELASRMGEESTPPHYQLKCPSDAVRLVAPQARVLDREVFWVLHLDAKNRLVGRTEDVTRGLLDASLVHPREVFREAIRSATAAVVLAHNHPSGDPTPSAEDIRITRQLVDAGRLLNIKVMDHVVVGRPGAGEKGYFSMREEGTVGFG